MQTMSTTLTLTLSILFLLLLAGIVRPYSIPITQTRSDGSAMVSSQWRRLAHASPVDTAASLTDTVSRALSAQFISKKLSLLGT